MAWNHRSKVVAIAVAIQSVPGVFTAPNTTTDLMAVASITNSNEPITADDPTASGAIWSVPPINLGYSATIGGTFPIRGPGGASPPAANAYVPGRLLQAAGWSEIILNAPSAAVLQAGSTTTALVLAATESSSDQFLVGAPVQQALIGAGFQQTSLIRSYTGASRTAALGETLGSAPATGAAYTIPAHIRYVLGTMTSAPPSLSISVWRDKKRYDYRDWRPSSLTIDEPVANDANQSFPSIEFSGKGIQVAVVDDTTPTVPASVLAIPVPPARNGKFYLDRVKLGHQSTKFSETLEIGAASNQNQAQGQDGYDILSGNRSIDLDLNQMNVSDFDIEARIAAGTTIPLLTTWGGGAGNNWGMLIPNVRLNPFSPGERNGYVNLTGNAYSTDVDKSAALTIWW
jgi:hypothetical protein